MRATASGSGVLFLQSRVNEDETLHVIAPNGATRLERGKPVVAAALTRSRGSGNVCPAIPWNAHRREAASSKFCSPSPHGEARKPVHNTGLDPEGKLSIIDPLKNVNTFLTKF